MWWISHETAHDIVNESLCMSYKCRQLYLVWQMMHVCNHYTLGNQQYFDQSLCGWKLRVDVDFCVTVGVLYVWSQAKKTFKAFDWIETTWERLHGVHLQLQWMSIAHMVGISSDCAWQSCFQLEPLVNVHSPCLPGNKFRSWNSQHEPLCFSIRSKLSNGFEIEHFPKVMYNEAKTFFTLKNKISKLQRSPK